MHRHHSLAGSPTDAVTLLAKLRHAQQKGRTSQPCAVTLPFPTTFFLTWYCGQPCHYQTLLRPSRRSRCAQDFSEFRGVNPHSRGNTIVYLVAPHTATQILDYHELILGVIPRETHASSMWTSHRTVLRSTRFLSLPRCTVPEVARWNSGISMESEVMVIDELCSSVRITIDPGRCLRWCGQIGCSLTESHDSRLTIPTVTVGGIVPRPLYQAYNITVTKVYMFLSYVSWAGL